MSVLLKFNAVTVLSIDYLWQRGSSSLTAVLWFLRLWFLFMYSEYTVYVIYIECIQILVKSVFRIYSVMPVLFITVILRLCFLSDVNNCLVLLNLFTLIFFIFSSVVFQSNFPQGWSYQAINLFQQVSWSFCSWTLFFRLDSWLPGLWLHYSGHSLCPSVIYYIPYCLGSCIFFFWFAPLFWWSTFSRSFLRFQRCVVAQGMVTAVLGLAPHTLGWCLLHLVHCCPLCPGWELLFSVAHTILFFIPSSCWRSLSFRTSLPHVALVGGRTVTWTQICWFKSELWSTCLLPWPGPALLASSGLSLASPRLLFLPSQPHSWYPSFHHPWLGSVQDPVSQRKPQGLCGDLGIFSLFGWPMDFGGREYGLSGSRPSPASCFAHHAALLMPFLLM